MPARHSTRHPHTASLFARMPYPGEQTRPLVAAMREINATLVSQEDAAGLGGATTLDPNAAAWDAVVPRLWGRAEPAAQPAAHTGDQLDATHPAAVASTADVAVPSASLGIDVDRARARRAGGREDYATLWACLSGHAAGWQAAECPEAMRPFARCAMVLFAWLI